MEKDEDCPLNEYGHKYFIFKSYETFESVPPLMALDTSEEGKEISVLASGMDLYTKKEYAVLGCNCGSVIKREVQ